MKFAKQIYLKHKCALHLNYCLKLKTMKYIAKNIIKFDILSEQYTYVYIENVHN
jgi:hypothetical protein